MSKVEPDAMLSPRIIVTMAFWPRLTNQRLVRSFARLLDLRCQ